MKGHIPCKWVPRLTHKAKGHGTQPVGLTHIMSPVYGSLWRPSRPKQREMEEMRHAQGLQADKQSLVLREWNYSIAWLSPLCHLPLTSSTVTKMP